MMEMVPSSLKPLDSGYNNTTKYLIPQIVTENKFFNDDYGFVNGFIGDINRPWFQDKLLIMFKFQNNSWELEKNFSKNVNWYSYYYTTINEIMYVVHAFLIPLSVRADYGMIRQGYLNTIDISNIYKYWLNISIDDLRPDKKNRDYTLTSDIIPIEDIMPSLNDKFDLAA